MNVAIRDAATVILVRDVANRPSVLMGQRGRSAAFMPDKFVFPGGAVDEADANIPLTLNARCRERLAQHNSGPSPETLAAAAIRELWEETGQRLAYRAAETSSWPGFDEGGFAPDASALRFFFRAITPEGAPRRFDARFFLADADALATDADDFAEAEPELSHLQWVPLDEVRQLNLAFITRVVLAELQQHLPRLDAPDAVPILQNDDLSREVIWLG